MLNKENIFRNVFNESVGNNIMQKNTISNTHFHSEMYNFH
jgi:hypothetical protein